MLIERKEIFNLPTLTTHLWLYGMEHNYDKGPLNHNAHGHLILLLYIFSYMKRDVAPW